jgi:hypothetical protein
MTQGQRLRNYLWTTFNPVSFAAAGASAGIGQWRNRPEEWGQGAAGFGRRYASAFGEHVTLTTITYGVSAVLHEDNRYFRSEDTGFRSRLFYAVSSTFMARRDDGTRRISISRIAGFVGAAFISRSWQPSSTNSFGNGVGNLGSSVGVAVGFNVAREFLPGLSHF